MIFEEMAVGAAEGSWLAHSLMVNGRRIRKGTRLEPGHIDALQEAGIERVMVARPEAGDVHEDEAATRLAAAVTGAGLEAREAATGRVNIHATAPGLVRIDRAAIHALNAVDEAITLATLDPDAGVTAGQMVATAKIIPYAVPQARLEAAIAAAGGVPPLSLEPFRPRTAFLIQTTLEGTPEKLLAKTAEITEARLAGLLANLVGEARSAHEPEALRAAIAAAPESDWLLIAGASAIADRRDVIPAALEAAGGEVIQLGMPVDPGNLILLGRLGRRHVIGLPGCARSPKLNGLDWVLQRLAVGREVDAPAIRAMGVGGLLVDTPARPLPRAESARPGGAVAAVVLAAGLARRMGSQKLLEEIGGKPLILHALGSLVESVDGEIVIVLGHEGEAVHEAVEREFPGRCGFVVNPAPEDGMGISLALGIRALPEQARAALVVLGDMPGLRPELIRHLISAHNPIEGRAISVPVDETGWGHPVLFDRRYFARLAGLAGDRGARALIEEEAAFVVEVPADGAAIHLDLDTPEALAAYREASATSP